MLRDRTRHVRHVWGHIMFLSMCVADQLSIAGSKQTNGYSRMVISYTHMGITHSQLMM